MRAFIFAAALAAAHALSLSRTLSDHMVLARSGAVVFGFDEADSTVKTVLAGQTYTTTTVCRAVLLTSPVWCSLMPQDMCLHVACDMCRAAMVCGVSSCRRCRLVDPTI